MLEKSFSDVYLKFKLHFYKKVFKQIQSRETSLTTVETFCVEIIHALGEPTVNEFANFIKVSSPNAAYKVNSLIQKGYIEKVQSKTDKREYHLHVTNKYYEYYDMSQKYIHEVVRRMENTFTKEQLATLEECLTTVSRELMTEVKLGDEE